MNCIDTALSIATRAHKGQFDKGGKPYIQHPIYVASLLKSENEKIVALLHDVVEDTDVSLNDLSNYGFSYEVLNAIEAITKRPNEEYAQYLDRLCKNEIAVSVKIADMTHNSDITRIPNPTQADYDRVKKYQDKLKFLKSLKH